MDMEVDLVPGKTALTDISITLSFLQSGQSSVGNLLVVLTVKFSSVHYVWFDLLVIS